MNNNEIYPQSALCELSGDKLKLLKDTVCKGASDSELQLFLHVCIKTGLDPFMKQIYSIPRGGQRTIQTSIDGLRLIAERTNRYAPGREAVYVHDDNGFVISATAYVKKMTGDGTWHEVASTAFMSEFNPGNNTFWKKMPRVMLAKCAEASALRKAFPAEMSGVYSDDEMFQSKKDDEHKVIEIDPKEQFEKMEEIFKKYVEFIPEDQDLLVQYLIKYTEHYKISPEETLDRYKDGEKLAIDFEKWKSKQIKK